MNQILKIVLHILHERIYKQLEDSVEETRFGFRSGLGARKALFTIQVLIERAGVINFDMFACFVYFKKAFNKVNHKQFMETLQRTGLDAEQQIIENLY